MIRAEPGWIGSSRYGAWRRLEDLWDGTPQWEYVPPEETDFAYFLRLLKAHEAHAATKVQWLEDEFLAAVSA